MDVKKSNVFVGIEIGGTKLQLVSSDGFGTINERLRYSIKAADGADGIKKQIEEGIQKLLSMDTIQSIGVGFGGPVDWKTGEIQLSHQVEGWGNFNIKNWLEKLSGLPVSIDNDANTAALAEAKRGCGKGYNNVFYMTIGSGIGGGLIVNEQIYHGRTPGEVEIGHLRLDKSGVTLEGKCSGWAVNNTIKKHIQKNPNSRLSVLAKNNSMPEAYLLTRALNEKDPDAVAIIDDVADDIAFALSHVVHLFNPAIIIIGGGLSLLKEHLIKPVTEKLPQYLLKALLPAPPIVIALLSEDVVPIGAIELASNAFKNYSPTTKKNTF
ncbi:MAG: ROK family protein [Segetibacter sp.]